MFRFVAVLVLSSAATAAEKTPWRPFSAASPWNQPIAAEAAISNPLLEDITMEGARGVLINITGGYDLTLFELDEAANRIREEVDPEANIIVGSTLDTGMEGKMRVSVVATGIDAMDVQQDIPAPMRRLHTESVAPAARSSAAAAAAPVMREEIVEEDEPVTATAADNSLARLVHVVQDAQERKGSSQRLAERFARPLVPGVLVLATLVAVIGSLVDDPAVWIPRALVVLVAEDVGRAGAPGPLVPVNVRAGLLRRAGPSGHDGGVDGAAGASFAGGR